MKIVLIGAGNVGWHLGKKLHDSGAEVLQVFSRNLWKAKLLAEAIHAFPINDFLEITDEADLYLLAIHDDAIGETAHKLADLGLSDKLVAHTSGGTPMTVIPQRRRGVFYPLQTFSLQRMPDFSQIPICVDAAQAADLAVLEQLAQRISPKVFRINDQQRAVLHVAAVFVNNFSNHLFAIGKAILDQEHLPFDLLLPLIQETVGKLNDGEPATMQTGPAKRRDVATMERHLQYLEQFPEYQAIYKLLSANIQRPVRTITNNQQSTNN